jgi:hypothetical protein
MLDDQLFLRPQPLHHTQHRSVSIAETNHGKIAETYMDIRVERLIFLSYFDQHQSVSVHLIKNKNLKFHGNAGGWSRRVSCGQTRLETLLSGYFANATEDMGRRTVTTARRCAILIAVTDVAAVHTGKSTGRR